MSSITKKSLWIDLCQGENGHGKAFGFIGTNLRDDYQGWFFTWPGKETIIRSVAEQEAVLDSLEADETCPREPQIPYRFARRRLEKLLKLKFDLRRK